MGSAHEITRSMGRKGGGKLEKRWDMPDIFFAHVYMPAYYMTSYS